MSDSDRIRKTWQNESLLSLGRKLEGGGSIHEPEDLPDVPEPATPAGGKAAGSSRANTDSRRASLLQRAKERLARERVDENAELKRQESEKPEPVRVVEQADEARSRNDTRNRMQADNGDVYWRPLIDPMRIISAVTRSKRWIILTTVLGGLAGLLVAISTPKEYYAATDILFDPRDLRILEYDLNSGGLPSDATLALIENQVGIIRSGTVLSGVVERLHLADDPEFNGQGGSLLGSLFSFGRGGASDAARRQAIAVGTLAEKLNVGRNDRTFIIHIGATTEDPDKSALIANTTAEVFLKETSDLQQATVNRANTELTSRLDELQAQVEAAEKAVADFKTQNDIVDAQGRLIADDEIAKLNDQLSTARARTAELNARVASSSNLDVDQVLGGSLPEQVASPVMTELMAQYATLVQQADRVAARLGPRHPDYQALQAELAGARQAIANELRRVTSSTQVELRRAVQVEQDLAARLARLKVEKGNLEDKQVTLRELQREAEARRSVYEGFLLRARQTGQQQNLSTSNISVISKAHPPLLPTGPRRIYIVLAGAVAGFLAGVALAAARGAYESLRGDMPAQRGPVAPAGPSGAAARGFGRGREDDLPPNGDFDPPPYDPGPRGGQRAYGHDTQAEPRSSAFSKQSVAQTNPAGRHAGFERAEQTYQAVAPGYNDEAYPQPGPFEPWQGARDYPHQSGDFVAVPPGDSAMPYPAETAHPADKAAFEDDLDATPAVEGLRQTLRALRKEIDALAERRARRYG